MIAMLGLGSCIALVSAVLGTGVPARARWALLVEAPSGYWRGLEFASFISQEVLFDRCVDEDEAEAFRIRVLEEPDPTIVRGLREYSMQTSPTWMGTRKGATPTAGQRRCAFGFPLKALWYIRDRPQKSSSSGAMDDHYEKDQIHGAIALGVSLRGVPLLLPLHVNWTGFLVNAVVFGVICLSCARVIIGMRTSTRTK